MIRIWKKCVINQYKYLVQILFKRATDGRWVSVKYAVVLDCDAGQCFVSVHFFLKEPLAVSVNVLIRKHHTVKIVCGCIAMSIVRQCISNTQIDWRRLQWTTLFLQMVFMSSRYPVIIRQLCCSSPIFEWSCCCHNLLWRVCGEDQSGPNIYLSKTGRYVKTHKSCTCCSLWQLTIGSKMKIGPVFNKLCFLYD